MGTLNLQAIAKQLLTDGKAQLSHGYQVHLIKSLEDAQRSLQFYSRIAKEQIPYFKVFQMSTE